MTLLLSLQPVLISLVLVNFAWLSLSSTLGMCYCGAALSFNIPRLALFPQPMLELWLSQLCHCIAILRCLVPVFHPVLLIDILLSLINFFSELSDMLVENNVYLCP